MALSLETVTFLFTDIQGSTRLWENHPDEMRAALAKHDALLRAAIEQNHGWVFKTVGDAFCAAFEIAADAAAAALQAQLMLHSEPWNADVTILVRMGLHTGAVECRDNDYFGPTLNRVARLMSIGHGSQILVSGETRQLIQDQLPPKTELLDKGTHRLKDLGRPEEVFQLQHPDLPSRFPSLRSLSNPDLPNNLPQQVTSFIGREKEAVEVRRLLTLSRLVTVTAAGGAGKSRLTLQVAAEVLDEFPDGVWFVELAALTEPSLVAPTVARLLNVGEAPEEPILRTLTTALKSRRLLLLLDNCEHLVAACAELASALIRSCPGVSLLASSREAFNINGETVYPLHALALPDPKGKHTVASVSQFDAVRLFLDRATAVRHDFTVSDQNASALAQLCHRLDGIPLALELAAARVRSLPLEEINKRLDNRFRLLTGGSRSALPRQQTLRALIDWSYDLLNEQEQRLLARLSAFSGGWTLPAAEAVCAGDQIEDWEVFDLLTALTDKSLVVSESSNEQIRFRLLETLREYSREKLEEMQEVEAVAAQHAQYYAEVLQGKSQQTGEVGESDFPWLLAEADNIRAALDWLWDAGRAEEAAAISVDLREFWTRKGWFREAFTNLERAVQRKDSLSDRSLCARVLKDAGYFSYLLGDICTALQLTEESVATAEEAGATEIQANALNGLALIVESLNDYARARALYMQAIELMRSMDKETVLADYIMNLGLLESKQGNHDAAQKLFTEAKNVYERRSNSHGLAHWLCNQSDLALRQSNWQEAQLLAEQSLERFRQIEHQLGMAYSLANLAKAAARQEKHAAVDAAVREAVAICVDTNLRDLMPMLLITQADSYLARGQIKNAAMLLSGAIRLRTLFNIPSTSEEQNDLYLIESKIRELHVEELFQTTRSQFSLINLDELRTQLLPLF